MNDVTLFDLNSSILICVVSEFSFYLTMFACISEVYDGRLTALTLKFVYDLRTSYGFTTSTICKFLIAQAWLGIHQPLRYG